MTFAIETILTNKEQKGKGKTEVSSYKSSCSHKMSIVIHEASNYFVGERDFLSPIVAGPPNMRVPWKGDPHSEKRKSLPPPWSRTFL